ncbi:GNAT family N-acetyltransferase [Bacillus velezensis]|uniref:GNAT family N-acetyltransferase n=1 Tax=Bacillus velezensis TaxID=492670 RepID=UPI0005B6325F|nr:GNAT family N-acetyltransferase [Bacillus velezensis]AWK45591.1 GNAT family N-acetyltransferase [Bacillus velezensis]
MNREKRLELKKVKPKHLQQFNQLLRYVFQVTNSNLHEVGWKEPEIASAKLPVLEQAHVLGWFDKDKLVSQAAVYPFQVRIFNKTFEMGGVTGVGTYPEYANMGLMAKLLYKALVDMRERGQSVSYLFPYSIPYYRRKGWEIISDKMTFEVKDFQLPKMSTVSGEVERVEPEHEVIKEVYSRFAHKSHAAMIRNELAWDEYWRWDLEELKAAVYYDQSRQANGYVLYWIADEVFHIKEMVYVNEEARRGLWNFISAHFSMVTKVVGDNYSNEPIAFLLEDAEIEETISPYFMARIVDIEQFINQYPFKPQKEKRTWSFTLEDPLLEWNQGVFTAEISPEGKAVLSPGGDADAAKLDIQTMTALLFAYRKPEYLHRTGRLECSPDTLEFIEDLLETQTPYFSDYF